MFQIIFYHFFALSTNKKPSDPIGGRLGLGAANLAAPLIERDSLLEYGHLHGVVAKNFAGALESVGDADVLQI